MKDLVKELNDIVQFDTKLNIKDVAKIRKWQSKIPNNSVIELAKMFGLEVYKIKKVAPNYLGELVEEENKIYVNSNHTKARQRFTIAHEIAHFILRHSPREGNLNWIKEEFEANKLASEILMPEKYIEDYLNTSKNDYILDVIEGLSHMFRLSKDAVKVKIQSIFVGYECH